MRLKGEEWAGPILREIALEWRAGPGEALAQRFLLAVAMALLFLTPARGSAEIFEIPVQGFEEALHDRMARATSGDEIMLPAGRHSMARGLTLSASRIRVRGKGRQKTWLDFTAQSAGSQSFLVIGREVGIEGFSIVNPPADGLVVRNSSAVRIRDVGVEWANSDSKTNGGYGIYPVNSTDVIQIDYFEEQQANTYDTSNARVLEKNETSETIFVYGPSGELLSELDAAGAPVVEYFYLEGEPIAQIRGAVGGGAASRRWVHNSHLGTPERLTDATRATVWEIQSEPFGEVYDVTADPGETQRSRFPGQLADQATQLNYNWHRYYDPSIGRFLSTEPVGQFGILATSGVSTAFLRTGSAIGLAPAGTNSYTYALNNPNGAIDPDGAVPVPLVTGVIGGVVSAGVNIASQAISNGGFSDIDGTDVLAAGAAGFAAGAAAPFTAGSLAATALVGGFANTAQSVASNALNGCAAPTFGEGAAAFAAGAVGAGVGGSFTSAGGKLFDEASPFISSAAARALNDAAELSSNVTATSIGRGILGSAVSSLSP